MFWEPFVFYHLQYSLDGKVRNRKSRQIKEQTENLGGKIKPLDLTEELPELMCYD